MSLLSLNSMSLFLTFLVHEQIRNVYMHSGKQWSLKWHLYSFTAGSWLIFFSHTFVIPLLFDITFLPWTLNLMVHTHYLHLYLDVSYGKLKVFLLPSELLSTVIFDLLLDSWSLTLLWLVTFPSPSILCTQFHNFSVFVNPETSIERTNNI